MTRPLFLALAIALPGPAIASEALCAAGADALRLPGAWTRTVRDGIVSYHSDAPRQAVTVAVYNLHEGLDALARAAVARRAVELARRTEQEWGTASVVLSAVVERASAGTRRICYWGEDPAAGRRFVSIGIADARRFRSTYYEAAGLAGPEFERRALHLLGPAADGTAGRRGLEAAPSSLPALRLPPLGLPLPR